MEQSNIAATQAGPHDLYQGWKRTGEVARELGVSETHVRRLGNRGTLEVVSTPLGRLYSVASVERYRAGLKELKRRNNG